MKRFLLTMSFFLLFFFGVRTLHGAVCMHSCVPTHTQDITEITQCAADIKKIRCSLDGEIKKVCSKSQDKEFCLKHILSLLDFELEIIDNLIDGKNGLPIGQLRDRRNMLITQTVPSVVRIYNGIMGYATADASLLCKLRDVIQEQERICTFLFHNKQEHFLQHMIAILETYYRVIRGRSSDNNL